MKSQTSNPKYQINPNVQNSKLQTITFLKVLVIGYWNLRPACSCLAMAGGFVCNLVLGICVFKLKIPSYEHLYHKYFNVGLNYL